ncbi:MAG: ABC transporter ATPase [Pseudomonadales bacterium]|nr:ABC transporter ATPase [Pseudomonadales bacterium]
MHRQVHAHILIPDCPADLNNHYTITATGEPSHDGSVPDYSISVPGIPATRFVFHTGPHNEGATIRGLSNEVLLAIVLDRMQAWQSGPFKCQENAESIRHIERALDAIRRRALARRGRGVLGANTI